MAEFLDSELFRWVFLPMLVFMARTADVSLATLRNVFIAKGFKSIVPVIGFFEVMIWLLSIRQIMQHLDNPMTYLGFAGGFAMGTYVGMSIERRLALGNQVLRIITSKESAELISAMHTHNMGITVIDGKGAKGPVKIIFTIFKRKDLELIQKLIDEHAPKAFYSIEDVRSTTQGVFPGAASGGTMDYFRRIFPFSSQK
jgi:uncharacterized protein YebE (UPF0316 family)